MSNFLESNDFGLVLLMFEKKSRQALSVARAYSDALWVTFGVDFSKQQLVEIGISHILEAERCADQKELHMYFLKLSMLKAILDVVPDPNGHLPKPEEAIKLIYDTKKHNTRMFGMVDTLAREIHEKSPREFIAYLSDLLAQKEL